jgi:hypothetical protein
MDIQKNQLVGDLKEAIKKKQNLPFPSSNITLFTTRRDGRTRNSFVWMMVISTIMTQIPTTKKDV